MRKTVLTVYEYFKEYSEEQVDYALSKLSKKDWEVLHLRYGKDLKNPTFEGKTTHADNCKYFTLVQKIKKILCGQHKTRKQYWNSDMTIYDYFNNYSREEIDIMVSKLRGFDKVLLELRCGKDLDHPVISENMTKKNKRQFSYTLIPKMSKMLENPEKYIKVEASSIYEYFSDYTPERIDMVMSKLNDDQLRLLNSIFAYNGEVIGGNVRIKNQYHKWHSLVSVIEKLLKSDNYFINDITGKACKKIYGYFEGYTKEQVDYVISLLPKKDKELLEKRFGPDLDNPVVVKKWDYNDNITFLKLVIPKMKNKLEKLDPAKKKPRKIMTIYERFNGYTKEEIDLALQKLSVEELRLLRLKYGEDLEHPKTNFFMTPSDKNKFNYIVKTRIKKYLEEPDVKIKPYRASRIGIYSFFNKNSEEEINIAIENLVEEEKQILKLKYGEDFRCSFSDSVFDSEKYKQYCDIMLKLSVLLRKTKRNTGVNRKMLSIYEVFKEYTREETDEVLCTLSDSDKHLIELKYGSDLDKPRPNGNMTQKDREAFEYLLLVKIKNRLKEIHRVKHNVNSEKLNKASLPELGCLISLMQLPTYSTLLKQYSTKEVMVLLLYFVGLNEIRFSATMISNFLDISESEVRDIVLNYLLSSKEELLNLDSGNNIDDRNHQKRKV